MHLGEVATYSTTNECIGPSKSLKRPFFVNTEKCSKNTENPVKHCSSRLQILWTRFITPIRFAFVARLQLRHWCGRSRSNNCGSFQVALSYGGWLPDEGGFLSPRPGHVPANVCDRVEPDPNHFSPLGPLEILPVFLFPFYIKNALKH